MSGNMPNNYFPYQPRFGDQRYQNQRFPNGQPNTYNRNQPFYPFGKPQNCYQPNFNPNWSGNGSCNPCDKLALANDAERTKLEFEAQKRADKNKFWTNIAFAGAGLIALPFITSFLKKIVGTPAISNNGGGGGGNGNNTISSGGGGSTTTLKTADDIEKDKKAAAAGWESEKKAREAAEKEAADKKEAAQKELDKFN